MVKHNYVCRGSVVGWVSGGIGCGLLGTNLYAIGNDPQSILLAAQLDWSPPGALDVATLFVEDNCTAGVT